MRESQKIANNKTKKQPEGLPTGLPTSWIPEIPRSGARYHPEEMNTKEFIDRRLPYTKKAEFFSDKNIGPLDQDSGIPLTFKKQVENQKDWYKQWHKAANRRSCDFSDEDGLDEDNHNQNRENLFKKREQRLQEEENEIINNLPNINNNQQVIFNANKYTIRGNPKNHHIKNFKPAKAYISENKPSPSLINTSQADNAPEHIKNASSNLPKRHCDKEELTEILNSASNWIENVDSAAEQKEQMTQESDEELAEVNEFLNAYNDGGRKVKLVNIDENWGGFLKEKKTK